MVDLRSRYSLTFEFAHTHDHYVWTGCFFFCSVIYSHHNIPHIPRLPHKNTQARSRNVPWRALWVASNITSIYAASPGGFRTARALCSRNPRLEADLHGPARSGVSR